MKSNNNIMSMVVTKLKLFTNCFHSTFESAQCNKAFNICRKCTDTAGYRDKNIAA